ncbi:zinc finger matrin-type protein 5 isoform 2-T2 [Polymixia lowei]
MGKRYYCDYCDRSFQDNMHNRKKHLNGVQHHRAKKAWFDHFRDSAAILYDEQAKKPCRKFLQTGNCGFGPNCRFSHMSEEDLANLKRQIEVKIINAIKLSVLSRIKSPISWVRSDIFFLQMKDNTARTLGTELYLNGASKSGSLGGGRKDLPSAVKEY